MRIVIPVLSSLLLLAACGNEGAIAEQKARLSDVTAQLTALQRELADKSKVWQQIEEDFNAASQTLRRALASGDQGARDAAQAAYETAQAGHIGILAPRSDLIGRIEKLEKKKAKILAAIKGLGG